MSLKLLFGIAVAVVLSWSDWWSWRLRFVVEVVAGEDLAGEEPAWAGLLGGVAEVMREGRMVKAVLDS